MYAQDSIELLKQSGIDFAQNEVRPACVRACLRGRLGRGPLLCCRARRSGAGCARTRGGAGQGQDGLQGCPHPPALVARCQPAPPSHTHP